jgi:hypothetical protein
MLVDPRRKGEPQVRSVPQPEPAETGADAQG